MLVTPYLGDLGQLHTPKKSWVPPLQWGQASCWGVHRDMWSIERGLGTGLVLLILDAFLLSIVIPISFLYIKNASVNHDGTHFLNSILSFAQQIFIKCLLCASFCYKLGGYCKKHNRQKTLALMEHTF